jgi:malonate decarboxylase alpha subunit
MHIDVIMASMYVEIHERRCAYTQPDKIAGENVPMPDWNRQARNRDARLERAAHLTSAKLVPASEARALLEAVLEPGDRVCLEGNNQKQADFLAKSLAAVSPERVHDLHMV